MSRCTIHNPQLFGGVLQAAIESAGGQRAFAKLTRGAVPHSRFGKWLQAAREGQSFQISELYFEGLVAGLGQLGKGGAKLASQLKNTLNGPAIPAEGRPSFLHHSWMACRLDGTVIYQEDAHGRRIGALEAPEAVKEYLARRFRRANRLYRSLRGRQEHRLQLERLALGLGAEHSPEALTDFGLRARLAVLRVLEPFVDAIDAPKGTELTAAMAGRLRSGRKGGTVLWGVLEHGIERELSLFRARPSPYPPPGPRGRRQS